MKSACPLEHFIADSLSKFEQDQRQQEQPQIWPLRLMGIVADQAELLDTVGWLLKFAAHHIHATSHDQTHETIV